MSLVHDKFILASEDDGETEEKSAALRTGDIAHRSLEIGEQATKDTLVIAPAEHQTSTGISTKKATREWLAELPSDAWVVSDSQARFLGRMWDSIHRNSAVASVVERIAHHEVSIRFPYKELPCRVRPDAVLDDGTLVDWKTTRHTNPLRDFAKSVMDFNYHLSHALYIEGARAAGFSTQPMTYIAISTSASAAVQALRLPQQVIDHGRRTLDRIIAEIHARELMGSWNPDGYGEIHEMVFPEYLLKGME